MVKYGNLKVGAKRYHFEWCHDLPVVDGSSDMDAAKFTREVFTTERGATDKARELIRQRKDAFGAIRIEEQELGIDRDICEHENRTSYSWHCTRYLFVSGESAADIEPWQMPI